jgi:hypothetical protein
MKHPWGEVERLYIEGETHHGVTTLPTQADLCTRFAIPRRTLEDRANKRRWLAKRESFQAEVSRQARRKEIERRAEEIEKARATLFAAVRATLTSSLRDLEDHERSFEPVEPGGEKKGNQKTILERKALAETLVLAAKQLPELPDDPGTGGGRGVRLPETIEEAVALAQRLRMARK